MAVMRVAIVADDLTGALDAAAPFAARGQPTAVALDAQGAAALGHFAVVSVDADSRHRPAGEAAWRVREAYAALAPGPGDVPFKKLDSTLRGQPVAETLAADAACGRPHLLLTPAFPAQGRIVRDGQVLVHGRPLAASEQAADGRAPPPAGPLPAAFAATGVAAAGWRPGTPLPEHRLVVADAESDADLACAVRAFAAAPGRVLFVGSRGLADALAEALYGPRPPSRPLPPARGRVLYVVGSRAAATRAQLEAFGHAAVGAEILAAPAVPGDPVAVAAHLGREAARRLADPAVGAVVASGGDTARAVLAAAGVGMLEVLDEPLPGIARARIAIAGRSLPFVGKAGGFGAPDVFLRIHAALAGGG